MPKTWTFFALKMLEMIVWHGLHTYTASPNYFYDWQDASSTDVSSTNYTSAIANFQNTQPVKH